MEGIPEEQLAEFKDAFEAFAFPDDEGNLAITKVELGLVLRALGQKLTASELEEKIKEVDKDQSGQIEFDEFLIMMKDILAQCDPSNELIAAFRSFDPTGNGLIGVEDLRKILYSAGEKLSDKEFDDIIVNADVDIDGRINYADFVRDMMLK